MWILNHKKVARAFDLITNVILEHLTKTFCSSSILIIVYKRQLVMNQLVKCQSQEELRQVRLDQIIVNPHQPRREFKIEELQELAQSIANVGLVHPPTVRFLSEPNIFELISGERRFRAAQLLKLDTIPVYVRCAEATLSAEAALIENIQRVDLNSMEIATALKRLMVEFSLSQDLLATKIGKKRSTIANYLRLLNLPKNIQESISKGFITMGHAKAILSLNEEEKQLLLHELILRDGLNVRETEAAAQRISEKSKKNPLPQTNRDFYIEYLEQKIREKLGTKVSIQTKGKRGRLTIDYYNLQQLENLMDILGVSSND